MTLSANSNQAHREIQNDSTEGSDSSANDDSITDDIQDDKQITSNKTLNQIDSKKESKENNESDANDDEINSESQNQSLKDAVSLNEQKNKYEKTIKLIQSKGIRLSQEQIDKLRIYKEQNNASRVELLKLYSEYMIENYNNQSLEEEEEEEANEKNDEIEGKNTEVNNKNEESKDKNEELKWNGNKIKNINKRINVEEEELHEEKERKLRNDEINKNQDKNNSKINNKKSQYPGNSNNLQKSQNSKNINSNTTKNLSPTSSNKSLKSNQSNRQNIRTSNQKKIKKSSTNSKAYEIPKHINELPIVDNLEVSDDATIEEVKIKTKIPHTKLLKVTKLEYFSEYEEDQDESTDDNNNQKKSTNYTNKSKQRKQKRQSTKQKRQIKRTRKRINQSGKQQDNQELITQPKRRSKIRSKSTATRNTKSKLEYTSDDDSDDDYIPLKKNKNKKSVKKKQLRSTSPNLLEESGKNNLKKNIEYQKALSNRRRSDLTNHYTYNNQNQLVQKKYKSIEQRYDQSFNCDDNMVDDQVVRVKNRKRVNAKIARSKSIEIRSNLQSDSVNDENQLSYQEKKVQKKTVADFGLDYKKVAQHPEILDSELKLDFFRSLKVKNDLKMKDKNMVWKKKRFTVEPIPDLSDSDELSDENLDDIDNDNYWFGDDKLPELKKISWETNPKDIQIPVQDISKVIRNLCIKYDTESLFRKKKK